jgi:uncharacterized RDD family membrane protein YckC
VTWRRLRAGLLDLACILGWVAVVAAVGVPLWLNGITGRLNAVWLNVVAGATVVVPVTFALAWLEGGRYEASPGKQWVGLRVRHLDGSPLGFGGALLRNIAKVAVPWTLGHAAAIALATGTSRGVPADVWVLTGVAYGIPLISLVSLFFGERRTPYDVLARSDVVGLGGPRRALPPAE